MERVTSTSNTENRNTLSAIELNSILGLGDKGGDDAIHGGAEGTERSPDGSPDTN